MNFIDFKTKVSNLKKLELPGQAAHQKLAPEMRIQAIKNINFENKKTNQAGVLAVFYPDNSGKTRFVLILRKSYQGVHSNQIGFPGGRAERFDEDIRATALRETREEVGIPEHKIEVLKKLTKLYIPPSNFWVHPFIGIMEETPKLVAQETEVEQILEVDLDHFLNENSLIKQNITASYAKNMEVPAFYLNNFTVWGATGMMLSEIKELLKKIL